MGYLDDLVPPEGLLLKDRYFFLFPPEAGQGP